MIEETLGSGGFGITYIGLQVGLNRRVAIKEFFMSDCCGRDPSMSRVTVWSEGNREIVERFRAKFVKEAQTIAQLDNPHVIRIYDIFEENGTAYYVMEYISGGSLEQYVKDRRRLDESSALYFVNQIADALTYIHGKNILHLDVKPSNVLLRESGEAVLIDFGISKRYDERGGQTSTTPVGISEGYAPIEQYTLGGVSQFDPSTDVYSLGAVLYKLLTGERPEEAPVLIAVGLTMPSYVSTRCSGVIRKAMSVRKSDRYQSAVEMKSALSGGGGTEDATILSLEEDKGKINGHEYVDLGLSVKWATCNVGASSPTEYGNYYAWGETSTKNKYSVKNSRTRGKDIGDIGGNLSYDAARANWGGSWRLPTLAEFEELINNCESEWVTQDGIKGRRFTSKKNGESIFLPAAGWCIPILGGSSVVCTLWSSTPVPGSTSGAYVLFFHSGNCKALRSGRSSGHSVRPVSE